MYVSLWAELATALVTGRLEPEADSVGATRDLGKRSGILEYYPVGWWSLAKSQGRGE